MTDAEREEIARRVEQVEQKVNGGTWDGVERRRAGAATEALGQKVADALGQASPANPVSYVWAVVVLGAVIALQCLILILMFGLRDAQSRAEDNSKEFRDSVVCYVVEISRTQAAGQVTPPADVLTKCGFITIPGNRD